MAEDGEGQLIPEQGEKLKDTAFVLKFDKDGLERELDNINPQGRSTLEAFLKLPEELAVPNGITLVVGPNGSGKSTFLGLIEILGWVTQIQKRSEKTSELKRPGETYEPRTWNQVLNDYIDSHGSGMPYTEWKKLGLAPVIAKHTAIASGAENIGAAKMYRIPELAGSVWGAYVAEEAGGFMPTQDGELSFQGGSSLTENDVVGSTQQVVDRIIFTEIEDDISRIRGFKTILLDEPTSNADLKRTIRLFKDLEDMRGKSGKTANFILATNEGLLVLHQGIPRIDIDHPERGVHYLKDYPLDIELVEGLKDMGYSSINTQP